MSECFAMEHMSDCCGSLQVLASNRAVEAEVAAYEASCGPPLCECVSQPTLAEDGSRVASAAEAKVDCTEGTCIARGSAL